MYYIQKERNKKEAMTVPQVWRTFITDTWDSLRGIDVWMSLSWTSLADEPVGQDSMWKTWSSSHGTKESKETVKPKWLSI